MSSRTIVKTAYQQLLGGITYLQANNGGTLKFAAAVSDFDLSLYAAPAVIGVPTVEDAGRDLAIGGTVVQTEMHYDLYVVASAFAIGAEDGMDGATGADQMIDDLVAALLGKALHETAGWPDPSLKSVVLLGKPFCRLHWVGPDRVVYKTSWRNAWMRQKT